MADDTEQQGAADRSRVSASESYEVGYFAKKHGLSQKAARDLIAEVGNDREKLDAAAMARPRAEKAAPKARAASAARRTTGKPSASTRSSAKAKLDQASPIGEAIGAAAPSLAAATRSVKGGAGSAQRSTKAAAKRAFDRAATVVRATRRSSASARQRATALPSAVGKRAGKAIDATRAAATGRTAAMIGVAAAGLVAGLAVNLGRKAIVQAPSILAGDWFEALKAEHALALAIFDQIEKTSDDEPAKRAILLTQLKHALGKHAFTEENVIYPALRDWGDKADADKLTHDHGYVKQYLYELDALDNGSPAFLPRIAAFRADLQAHIREEEDAIFPPLHASLGDAKNAEITALANKEGFKLA